MSLNINNQLDLLHDLLSLHAEECCGSTSECEQISRIIRSLQKNPSLPNNELSQILEGIDQYGSQGATSTNLDDHITSYQSDIEQWLQVIKDSNY
ncbi:YtzH-like family protein [Gracilibacillus caseinilyticus]|uniref:YtzH-like family protein n=1 Tax=Gracilibacillus caseinilyticus TaxID=2932256 RepID=A0ABY4ESQ5_9BACI|nr:YtzH-like family protein [Gracilibacillus caseinilyticus]UOQ47101.1 YtzH-like family protein [Gracilibacillus caseinilyticus]